MSDPHFNCKLEEFPEKTYGEVGTKERRQNLCKNNQLQRSYDLTLAAYNAMSEAQNHKCAICGEEELGFHNRGEEKVPLALAVDHDHSTGAIRALLCAKCNKAIGLFYDKPSNLLSAYEYLLEHKFTGED